MNSKWLVENLTEVDSKVKKMIKIIDEDADSFARRAEMFYKKRPELMKLVGEFHSAYQGLAARYDRVSGLLRLDLRLMADGNPKKVVCEDDNTSSQSSCGRRDGDLVQDCYSFTDFASMEYSKDGKSLESRARKSLKFEDDDASQLGENESVEFPADFEYSGELHLEILSLKAEKNSLKESLDKLDAEKHLLEKRVEKLAGTEEHLVKAKMEHDSLKQALAEKSTAMKLAEGEAKLLQSKVEDEVAKREIVERRNEELERMNRLLSSDLEAFKVRFAGVNNGLEEKHDYANKSLQSKVAQAKLQNKSLSEVNLSLALAVKDSKSEIACLKEELASLTEKNKARANEINDLKGKLTYFEVVGFDAKQLQEETARLKEEKQAYMQTIENSSKLESCIPEMRKKMMELETENSVLVSNNSFLISQLQGVNCNMEKLCQEKCCLEKANLDANMELHELQGKAKSLEDSCRFLENKVSSKDGEIIQLKTKIGDLELENGKLRDQIGWYAGAFVSLKESVTTLENRSNEQDRQEEQEFLSTVTKHGGHVELKELQAKIANIERLVTDREKNLTMENTIMKTKLEAAMNHVEELKTKNRSHRQWHSRGRYNYKLLNEDLKMQSMEDINDISLDETSEFSSVGFSRASTVDLNDPMELWDATLHKGSIDLTVDKPPKGGKTRGERKIQRKRSLSFVDKEVSLENLVVSRSIPAASLELQDRKILDRLDSDVQKLTRLHITIQELKRMMEMTEKMKKGSGVEYDCIKEQMEESEETIIRLFNVYLRLRRSVEVDAISMEETTALAFEEKRGVTRRKVTDQARRMSDKIGRLQLEIQKLQFLLIKLDDQSKARPKIKIADRKSRVLLRDYLYSNGNRGRQAPKRSNFCACTQPQTKGD